MTTPPTPQPTVTTTVVRKLIVEVIEARDLLPKDGQGSSSPYAVIEFDGQRKRTQTRIRDLNPVWNEQLEFLIVDPKTMEAEELDVEVYNDKRVGGSGRKNHFLGRVRIAGTQFARKGDQGLIYFPLEKKSILSWVRGDIGLVVYYADEMIEEPENDPPQPDTEKAPPPAQPFEEEKVHVVPTEAAMESQTAQTMIVEEMPGPPQVVRLDAPPESIPEVRRMQTPVGGEAERVRVMRRPNGDFAPKVITGKFAGKKERIPSFHLVEPMMYLFVRTVKARGVSTAEDAYVKIRTGGHCVPTKPSAYHRPGEAPGNLEWHQVFAFSHNRPDSAGLTLEISLWESRTDAFLGGVCFDLSDVPVRDPPDSPLAPQWYRLEGGDESSPGGRHVSGDIMLSVWMGTQADDVFPEAWNTDAPYVGHTRSKVYQSPKLWYLRVTVIEAQDLHVVGGGGGPPLDVRVRTQLGFQSARTRRPMINHSSSFSWHEDLMFVASEPLEDQLIVLVEERSAKDAALLGHVMVALTAIEQRLDERSVASKWYGLEGGGGEAGGGPPPYCGRIHLRLCLEGGYHVLDEAAHLCSDFRPTAKQLWKPAVGVLELGILGARGLLPMKTKGSGSKGSTDAYCVAKYGKKWVRTRTITDSFDPRWNEQYTWQVYDPCTVLTVGVFDNWRMFGDMAEEGKPDFRIGKVRIRVATLESNRVYTNSYPLLVLLRSGLKKMGEIELAVRFACPAMLPDTCAVYGQPLLPRMHYLRPLGVAQQEALRGAATRMVAAWLARSEPPLGAEVVRYMLDADSHAWSMRKSKANWFRIMAVIAWAVGLARWMDEIRRWKNPLTTVLVHVLYLVLVWYPELIVPTVFLYVFLIGAWYYRFRLKIPAGMDIRLSQADTVDPDELDEEFDTVPSSKPPEVVRARYDRLRMLAGRIQTVLGDMATQGERLQALVSWRDPRATRLFIGACLMVAVVLYAVPPKMVAVAVGFYLLRHPMFRDPMPPTSLNFFRRLPSLSDRLM
ncbi:hypothetical protein ACLOJK_026663 [Asimina triloba]